MADPHASHTISSGNKQVLKDIGRAFATGEYKPTADDQRELTEVISACNQLGMGHFYDIVNTLPQMVSYLDTDLIYRFVNTAYQETFELEPADIIGHKLSDLIGPEAWAKARPYVKKALSGERVDYEETYEYAIAGKRTIRGTLIPDIDTEDQVQGYWAILDDITDLRQTAEELDEQKQLFEAIASYTCDWENWVDPDGKLVWLNSAVERLTGYTPQDCLAMHDYPMAIIHPEDRPEMRALLQQAQQGSENNDWVFRIVHRNGEIRWMSISWQPLYDSRGNPLGHRSSIRDITERKAMQSRLQRLEQFDQLGGIAGGIAHDFNNLLVGILGNAELLMERVGNDITAREMLQGVIEAGRRASDLSKLMLVCSGKAPMKKSTVDLNGLMGETLTALNLCHVNQADLMVVPEADLPPIQADPAMLKEVLVATVSNAVESMDQPPQEVRIETHCLDIDEAYLKETYLHARSAGPGRYVMLRISDTGRGMTGEEMSRLFEPFFSTKCIGRGLGLPAVLGIIQAHLGAIHIDSTPGKGTKVDILLPVNENPSTE